MRALVFDCDGVLAETEGALHLPAFNEAFAEFGLTVEWTPTRYAQRLLIGGGKERIASLFTPELVAANGLPTGPEERRELIAAIHARKTALFELALERGNLAPRPGVARLAREADANGWRLAVASTSTEPAVRAVIGRVFEPSLAAEIAVFAGDVVAAKKPDPAIYQLAISTLGVAAADTIAVEDSRNGLLAAVGAGLTCVVTPSEYTAGEEFGEAALLIADLGESDGPTPCVRLADLEELLAQPAAQRRQRPGDEAGPFGSHLSSLEP